MQKPSTTYTTRTAHGNTRDAANLLQADTLQGLTGLALGTRSHLVGSVHIGTSVIGVKLLDIKLTGSNRVVCNVPSRFREGKWETCQFLRIKIPTSCGPTGRSSQLKRVRLTS